MSFARLHAVLMSLALLLAGLSPVAHAAGGGEEATEKHSPKPSCRWAVAWDVERDLVAYEMPTACSLLSLGFPDRSRQRPDSVFELRRISSGALLDSANCAIRFTFGGNGQIAESRCDFETISRSRPTFRRLRASRRGDPADPTTGRAGDKPLLAEGVDLDPADYGVTVLERRRSRVYSFVLVGRGRPDGYDELLLRVPLTMAGKQSQKDLIGTARLLFETHLLDSGVAFARAARTLGSLDAAMLARAFCDGPDIPWRLRRLRGTLAGLGAGEVASIEKALTRRGCFPRLDPARYDASRAEMDVVRTWMAALGSRDADGMLGLSSLPFRAAGFTCRKARGMVGEADDAEILVAERDAFDRFAQCLFADSTLVDAVPKTRDGEWLVNRGNLLDGWTGDLRPIDQRGIPARLGRYRASIAANAKDATLVEATIVDNNGVTITYLFVLRSGPEPRVAAVYMDFMFEE